MRKKTKESVIKIADRLLPINTYDGKRSCYVEMLEKIDDQMTAMLSHHSKVLMVRVDIHLEKDFRPSNNDIMSHYLKKIRRWAERKYPHSKVGFAWVRELCSSKKVHYHMIIMLNGHEVQDHRTLMKETRRIMKAYKHLGYEHAPYIKNAFTMVHRGDVKTYEDVFERYSYLAKTRTKDKNHLSDKGKNYSTSRIKKNPNPIVTTRQKRELESKAVRALSDDERQIDWINDIT